MDYTHRVWVASTATSSTPTTAARNEGPASAPGSTDLAANFVAVKPARPGLLPLVSARSSTPTQPSVHKLSVTRPRSVKVADSPLLNSWRQVLERRKRVILASSSTTAGGIERGRQEVERGSPQDLQADRKITQEEREFEKRRAPARKRGRGREKDTRGSSKKEKGEYK